MKKSLCLLSLGILGMSSLSSFGQGYVVFRNFDQNLSTMQLIYDSVSGNPLVSDFWAQLYVGAANATEGGLVAVGTPQAFGDVPFDGLVIGGEVANSFVTAGALGAFQMRAWPTNYATWNAAYAAALNDANIHVGKSTVFQSVTGTVGNGGEIVFDLPAFTVDPVPEPSLIGAAVLGTAFFVRRRRQQSRVSDQTVA